MFLKTLAFVALLFSLGTSQSHLAPVVDLKYELYQGYYDNKYDINAYKGYDLLLMLKAYEALANDILGYGMPLLQLGSLDGSYHNPRTKTGLE